MNPRWLRCLARSGALLFAAEGDGFAVYPGGDRRRRPLARASAEAVRDARARGLLSEDGAGLRLSEDGVAALRRATYGQAGQHRDMVTRTIRTAPGRLERLPVNRNASPLGRYSSHLTQTELLAGERFIADYARSSLNQPVTRNWSLDAQARSSGGPRGPEDASLAAIAAKDRVMDALAVLGAGLDQAVLAVCIREESLPSVERRFGWGARSARTVLKLALAQLAAHYGMTAARAA